MTMKQLALAGALLVLSTSMAFAQTSNANSSSTASGQSAGNITTFNSSSQQQAPGAYAPGLAAAGIEVCTGSASAGISGPGFGISFGSTTTEQGCEARLDSRTLWSMGYKAAAGYRLCTQPNMALALAYAGTPCPPEFYNSRQQRAITTRMGQPVQQSNVATQQSTVEVAPVGSAYQSIQSSSRRYDPDKNSWTSFNSSTGKWE